MSAGTETVIPQRYLAGNRPRLVEELSSFVQRTGIPFFKAQMDPGRRHRLLRDGLGSAATVFGYCAMTLAQ